MMGPLPGASEQECHCRASDFRRGIPHAMLIDPHGIVRFEGMPHYLEEKSLEKLMAMYSQ